MGKEAEEIKDLIQKLAQNPDSMVFVQLADAYRRSADLERSVDACLKGLALHPTYSTARIILGRDYFDLGRLDDAAAEFRRVEAVDPDNIVVHRMLGQIALRKGLTAEAITRQQKVLALDPDDIAAQELLKEALLKAKQPEGGAPPPPTPPPTPAPVPAAAAAVAVPAPATPERAKPLADPESRAKALKVADLYVKKRALDKAREVLDEILAADPENPAALERRRALDGGRLAADPEVDARRKAEEEQRRTDEESRRRVVEEETRARRQAEEAEARRKAEQEAAEKRRREAEEAEARRKAEQEAAEKRRKEAGRALSPAEILGALAGPEDLVGDIPPAPAAQGAGSKGLLRGLTDVVEGSVGACLAGLDGVVLETVAVRPGLDAAALGAEAAGLLKGAVRTSRDFGLGQAREIVVTTEKAMLLIIPVGASYLAALALDLDGNLGRGRLELRRMAPLIERNLA